MIEILIYALPCWIFNLSHTFIPLLKKIPGAQHFSGPWSERFVGSQGWFTVPVVIIVPLFLLPFGFSYPIVLFQSALVAAGDITGSFIKRRLGIKKGAYLPFVDHGDYMILTGIVFVSLDLVSFSVALHALILTYLAHPIVCYIGWRLGIKREPL